MNGKKLLRMLNCPKCNGKAHLLNYQYYEKNYIVECSKCHFNYGNYQDSARKAIAMWNGEIFKTFKNLTEE